jgi:hypothetical protein
MDLLCNIQHLCLPNLSGWIAGIGAALALMALAYYFPHAFLAPFSAVAGMCSRLCSAPGKTRKPVLSAVPPPNRGQRDHYEDDEEPRRHGKANHVIYSLTNSRTPTSVIHQNRYPELDEDFFFESSDEDESNSIDYDSDTESVVRNHNGLETSMSYVETRNPVHEYRATQRPTHFHN